MDRRCENEESFDERSERKKFFKFVKHLESSLQIVTDAVFVLLSSNKSEQIKLLLIDHILDIQELMKTSICKGITSLKSSSGSYSSSLKVLLQQPNSLSLVLKLTTLKLVIEDCISFKESIQDVGIEVLSVYESRLEELFSILKAEQMLHGIIVNDLKNDKVFAIFDKDFKEVIFFNQYGILLVTKLCELKLIRRKQLYYICHKGTEYS